METIYKDKVNKVRDHVAIAKFLNKAFGEEVDPKDKPPKEEEL